MYSTILTTLALMASSAIAAPAPQNGGSTPNSKGITVRVYEDAWPTTSPATTAYNPANILSKEPTDTIVRTDTFFWEDFDAPLAGRPVYMKSVLGSKKVNLQRMCQAIELVIPPFAQDVTCTVCLTKSDERAQIAAGKNCNKKAALTTPNGLAIVLDQSHPAPRTDCKSFNVPAGQVIPVVSFHCNTGGGSRNHVDIQCGGNDIIKAGRIIDKERVFQQWNDASTPVFTYDG